MKDKNFLIEKGMYEKSREDVFYLVGYFYDYFKENDTIDLEEFKKVKKYLNEHRELINNGEYSIALYETIRQRLRELFPKNKKEKSHGIYGIYIDDDLVYIGKTSRDFKTRFNEHKRNIDLQKNFMYKELNKYRELGHQIYAKPLIIIENLNVKNKKSFSNIELECMELALISYLKPKYNFAGNTLPYIFNK